ncbi:MAG: family 20 glycosylhydrolase [Clostridia bacterium]|nr:family 20 glycosylhydrolase [Clostridia bacterium]
MDRISFKRFGVMLDMSRNSVMRPDALKDFATLLRQMGYNTLLLYTEDTYEIPGEPYFGHFRGRYTAEDIRGIVAHCEGLGMEVIPCIQTLAHLATYLKWRHTAPFRDCGDILLAESDETYALIRKMLRGVKAAYKSRHVHVGMDEAHLIGLGQYLKKHGYTDRFGILSRHLQKVCEMAREEGLEPNMWSDMFFRLANGGVYSLDRPKLDPDRIGPLPEDLNLTYWDYYSTGKRRYRAMFRAHKRLTDRIWFAGGIWTWKGWAPDNRHSVNTCLPGLAVAAEEGVENAFVTLWGDDGGECSRFAALPSLFAVARFAAGETDKKRIAEQFEECFGIPYRAFLELDLKLEKDKVANPEKYLLYNDPFLGLCDSTVYGTEDGFYRRAARRLRRYAKHPRFGALFASQAALAQTLSYKALLGKKTRECYVRGDREGGKALLRDYGLAIRGLRDFIGKFRTLWHWENRPQGFEVQEVRLGGLLERLQSCRVRLADWVENGTEIPELAEPCLDFFGGGTTLAPGHFRHTAYEKMYTPGQPPK